MNDDLTISGYAADLTAAGIREATPLKRFIDRKLEIDEPCAFPDFVFQGWALWAGTANRVLTYFCPWGPDLYAGLFTTDELNHLKVLRWEYQQGKYCELFTSEDVRRMRFPRWEVQQGKYLEV